MKKDFSETFWANSSGGFEGSQTFFEKKSLSDELFFFFFESSESYRVSLIYMSRIRFFGPEHG